jgi:hypothetical protein
MLVYWLVPTLHTITSSHPTSHDNARCVLTTRANVSRKVRYLCPRQATAGCCACRKRSTGQNGPRQLTATLGSCNLATNGFSMSVTWRSKTTRKRSRPQVENSTKYAQIPHVTNCSRFATSPVRASSHTLRRFPRGKTPVLTDVADRQDMAGFQPPCGVRSVGI